MSDPRRGNEARYDAMASGYERMLRLGSLGRMPRIHRVLAEAVDAPDGGRVVEVGCGPGNVTPHLRAALDDSVSILGIDLSGEMIARARRRAAERGWRNVSYEKADVTSWEPAAPLDAVVFSLVLSGLPGPLDCLDRALGWLRAGGQVVILDDFLMPGRPIQNLVTRLKAPGVGAVPEELPIEEVKARLDDVRVEEFLVKQYQLVTGRKPPGQP